MADEKKEKKINNLYWLIGIGVVILIIIAITLMIVLPSTPTKAVNGMLDALKIGDFEKAGEYVNYEELMNAAQLTNEEGFDLEAQKLLFNKLSWKINKVTEENDKANIEIEVTNKDLKTIIGNYLQVALKNVFSGSSISEEEVQNKLLEELKKEDAQLTTITKNLTATKQDENWKIEVNSELQEVLFPGLTDAINALSNSAN